MTTPVADGGPDLLEWTVMSMGAGAITGGLVFGFLANAQASKSEQVGGQLAVEDAKDLALIANVLYALGGTGIATGFALWYFDEDAPADLAIAPMLSSDGAFVSIPRSLPMRRASNYSARPFLSRCSMHASLNKTRPNRMSISAIAIKTVSVDSFAN